MIVFVCTGNICRSPMAEGYARAMYPDLDVSSAGIHPVTGSAPTPAAQHVMLDEGIDIGDIRSGPVPVRAQTAYCMTRHHLEWVRASRPDIDAHLLRPDGGEIADPYGYDVDVYVAIRDEIKAALVERLGEPTGPEP